MNNKNTTVISGFPGIGKSHLYKTKSILNLIILDADSSKFHSLENGELNLDFPDNYIQYIKSNIGKADIILTSMHDIVIKGLDSNNISYIKIYPDRRDKEIYLRNYYARGNSNEFIERMDLLWNEYINQIESNEDADKYRLPSRFYLSDVIKYIH